MKISSDDIKKVIDKYAIYLGDRDVKRTLDDMYYIEEYLSEKGEDVDMWKEFYEMIFEKLRFAEKELAKKGVTNLSLKNFEMMIMNKFIEWGNKDFEKNKVRNDIIVYGDTMGFILHEGEKKWRDLKALMNQKK